MNINPVDQPRHKIRLPHRRNSLPPQCIRLQNPPRRMKQKCPGAAGWIKYAYALRQLRCDQITVNRVFHPFVVNNPFRQHPRQPVRGIILAKGFALLRRDQLLVKSPHHIPGAPPPVKCIGGIEHPLSPFHASVMRRPELVAILRPRSEPIAHHNFRIPAMLLPL